MYRICWKYENSGILYCSDNRTKVLGYTFSNSTENCKIFFSIREVVDQYTECYNKAYHNKENLFIQLHTSNGWVTYDILGDRIQSEIDEMIDI